MGITSSGSTRSGAGCLYSAGVAGWHKRFGRFDEMPMNITDMLSRVIGLPNSSESCGGTAALREVVAGVWGAGVMWWHMSWIWRDVPI